MFGSYILDFAIGMIFVYLLLSVICSAANEVIEAQLKNRATDLERGLKELLNDPAGTGLVQQLYHHPLIFSLFKGTYDPQQAKNKNLPSYIPSRNFALALLDIIRQGAPPVVAPTGGSAPAAAAVTTAAVAPAAASVQAVRSAVGSIGNDRVQRALETLLNTAGDSSAQLQADVEAWYNSSMERVSGWYKRRVQWIIIGLGMFLTVLLNADTLAIANRLSQDSALRQAVADAAVSGAKQPAGGGPATPEQLKVALDNVNKLGLPIGWVFGTPAGGVPDPRRPPDTKMGWVLKFVGWLMTALAISLGAPFWFDLLNKVVTVRGSVKPKAPDANT